MSAFISLAELKEGGGSTNYPKSLTEMYEVKEFIGRAGKAKSSELRVGHVSLKAGADYPAHSHPAAEVYVQISGKVEWSVGRETKLVKTLTAINISPGTSHAMKNVGEDEAQLIYFWYAPHGNIETLLEDAKLDR